MLNNNNLLQYNFNKKYFRYRIIFYWQQVKELLYRHKLFAIFVVLITSSSLNHIKYLGYPIAALVSVDASLKLKVFSLALMTFVAFAIAKSQAKAIKGGVFRGYIDILYPNNSFNKVIDFLMNAIAMNVVVALFIMAYVYTNQWFLFVAYNTLLLKFIITWLLLLAIQINVGNNNIVKALLCGLLLIFTTFGSKVHINEVFVFIVAVVSLGLLMFFWDDSHKIEGKSKYNLFMLQTATVINLMPFFTCQIGWLRANSKRFMFLCVACFVFSLAMLQLQHLEFAKFIIITLSTLQVFIFATFFISMVKNESNYKVLYTTFSYNINDFKYRDFLFVTFCYLIACIPLYFIGVAIIIKLIIAILTLLVSRYYLCYFRNAYAFMFIASMFLNLVEVNIS